MPRRPDRRHLVTHIKEMGEFRIASKFSSVVVTLPNMASEYEIFRRSLNGYIHPMLKWLEKISRAPCVIHHHLDAGLSTVLLRWRVCPVPRRSGSPAIPRKPSLFDTEIIFDVSPDERIVIGGLNAKPSRELLA